MMPDLFMTESGDLAVSPSGDLAVTPSPWREYSQQAYISLLTEIGDFVLYPSLGADLHQLMGMPQSAATGEYGRGVIEAALRKNPKFNGIPIQIKAVPTGFQTIRFDIYMTIASKTDLVLSIEQDLEI
jgi:hypothetical protein